MYLEANKDVKHSVEGTREREDNHTEIHERFVPGRVGAAPTPHMSRETNDIFAVNDEAEINSVVGERTANPVLIEYHATNQARAGGREGREGDCAPQNMSSLFTMKMLKKMLSLMSPKRRKAGDTRLTPSQELQAVV